MTIIEMTNDTMDRLAEAFVGKGKFTVRDVVYSSIAAAMADAFERGIKVGMERSKAEKNEH